MLRDHFFHEGRLTEAQALFILEQATELMKSEPNMLRINGPVVGMSSSSTLSLLLDKLPSMRRHSWTICKPLEDAITYILNQPRPYSTTL